MAVMMITGVGALVALLLMLVWMRRSASAGSESSYVDPLAEAEVYLAYGRKQQAIETLEQALRNDDSRHDIRRKLSELKKRNDAL